MRAREKKESKTSHKVVKDNVTQASRYSIIKEHECEEEHVKRTCISYPCETGLPLIDSHFQIRFVRQEYRGHHLRMLPSQFEDILVTGKEEREKDKFNSCHEGRSSRNLIKMTEGATGK